MATGYISFGNEQGAEALFRNLVVTDPSQAVLYQSSLTDPAILDQFAAGTNVLPSIMDGAKRDRLDFTGDIGISGLTILYSTFAREYVAGTIELFSAYQRPDGRIATFLPPQYHPGVTPPTAVNATSLLISDYDLQHVTSIYHYYLYTGDRAFLQAQWPVVQRVIAAFEGMMNSQGLVATDTLTNAHFYGVLLQAAQLATALGQADVAAGYTATAAQLRAAINATLFNASTGLYDVSTAQPGVADQQGNAYAVLYGVAPAPGASLAAILQTLTAALYRTPTAPNATGPVPVQQSSGSTQVGPYTSAYLLSTSTGMSRLPAGRGFGWNLTCFGLVRIGTPQRPVPGGYERDAATRRSRFAPLLGRSVCLYHAAVSDLTGYQGRKLTFSHSRCNCKQQLSTWKKIRSHINQSRDLLPRPANLVGPRPVQP